MTDYEQLVKALRYCAESGDFKCGKDCPMHTEYPNCLTKMDTDASAAIEELQEMLKAVQTNSGINFRMWEEAQAEVERLQAQLPKRGKWELIDGAEPMRWGCSRCKYLSWETSNFCPNCGADMRGEQDE